MNHFAARAGVDGSRLLSGLGFDYDGLGADATLVEPSLAAAGWTEEDARLFNIVGSLGTNSPEGAALVADLKGQYGEGWVAKWGELQDSLQAKYLRAESDAARLAELQATTTAQAAASDPTQQFLPAGSVPYSIHDINAYQNMSPEDAAAFLMGFEDLQAASYFTMVAGMTDAVARLIPPPLGNKGAYMGADGTRYDSYEDLVAAGGSVPGATSVTTSTGEVITDPDRLKNLTFEETFGTPLSPAPQWTAPTEPVTGGFYPATAQIDPATGKLPNGMVPEYGSVPSSAAAAPIVPSSSLDVVDVTRTGATVNVKGQPKNLVFGKDSFAPTPNVAADVPEGEIPVATAGFGGSLGLLAIAGIGLAILASKRKR